jgi:hypothetical protein
MSDLANQTPASTYKGLLQVGDYTDGVDSTVKAVLDGEGTASALAIGTTKVGVGTTSPSVELEVNGQILATGSIVGVSNGGSATGVGMYSPASNQMGLCTNSTERLRIDSDGNVGVGTASPHGLLHLYGDTNTNGAEIFLQVNNNNVTDFLGTINFGNNADSTLSSIRSGTTVNNTTSYLAFETADTGVSSEAMRIDSDGNCGIGTDDPSAKLEVLQSSATNTLTEVASFLGGNYDSVSNAESFKFFHQTTSLNTNRGVAFKSIDGSLQIQTIVSSSDISESNNISLQPDGGRCGIGTSNPDFNLSVVSDTDPAKIGIHGYGSFSDGTVAAQLYFVGKDSDGGNRNLAHIQVREHDHTLGSGSMEFVTRISGIEDARMTINEDGNVGIGTDSPSAPLEVASTTGGLIMPRMTTTQMNAISSPTDGEMIYNTTENKFYGRANGAWTALH